MNVQPVPAAKMKRWRREAGYCLRHLDERKALSFSSFADLRAVQQLARERHQDVYEREGLTLQEIFRDRCARFLADFAGTREAGVLEPVLRGGAVADLAQPWGMHRSQIHRRYWQPVLDYFVYELWKLERREKPAA